LSWRYRGMGGGLGVCLRHAKKPIRHVHGACDLSTQGTSKPEISDETWLGGAAPKLMLLSTGATYEHLCFHPTALRLVTSRRTPKKIYTPTAVRGLNQRLVSEMRSVRLVASHMAGCRGRLGSRRLECDETSSSGFASPQTSGKGHKAVRGSPNG